jgi:hypothetical protein
MKAYLGAVTISVLISASSLLVADSDRLPFGDASISSELAVIANRHTSESRLLKAIGSLRDSDQAAAFWAEIANDSRYSANHRGYCAEELFKQHVKPGMTISEVAAMLNGARWLTEERIHKWVFLGGYLPLKFDRIGQVISIDSSSDEKMTWVILISFDTPVSATELLDAFQGRKVPAWVANDKVMDLNVRGSRAKH